MKNLVCIILICFFSSNVSSNNFVSSGVGASPCYVYVTHYKVGSSVFFENEIDKNKNYNADDYIKLLRIQKYIEYTKGWMTSTNMFKVADGGDIFVPVDNRALAIDFNNFCEKNPNIKFIGALMEIIQKYIK